MKRLHSAGMLVAMAVAAGCGESRPIAPLVSSAFIARPGETPTTFPARGPATKAAPAAAPAQEPPPTTSPTTQTWVPHEPENAASIPVMLVPGQYQTIGGVVSEVNGHPIYANRVLRLVKGELAARATEMSPDQFRKFATEELRKRTEGLERDELIFGAADRFLQGEDRMLAEFLTMQFRTKKITDAGGSVELAQRTAEANGDNFEEMVFDKYRQLMTEVYYRKKVYPRIQISADDMRKYYAANVGREFTELPEVTFRLIKVDPKLSGGKDKAKTRAADLKTKLTPANFEQTARDVKQNDDARLARTGGEEVPVQKGAYRLENVEAALWTTPVGALTPVIEDSGAFYIAKVESRKEGSVQGFEEKKVQERIFRTLWSRQFRKMADEIEKTLRENSMVRKDPDMMKSVIEMAMQGYALWAKGK